MKRMFLVVSAVLISAVTYAQDSKEIEYKERIEALEKKVDKMSKLKFSGYVQTQWTWNEAKTGSGLQNDFSVRRGRIKAVYANKYGEAVIQLDATEDGVGVKDAYLALKIPETNWVSFRGGIFDRPFGYEISYSSSRRETPERSLLFVTLFPKERDLGGEIILKGPGTTFLKNFTLNAGIFAGNGGQTGETDSGKDFIGHLAYGKKKGNINWGLGTSLYAGGVRLAGDEDQTAFKMAGGSFVQDNELKQGDYAKRMYYGFDGQFSLKSCLGTSSLRAEYIWGTQPGAMNGSMSPTGAITVDIYSRNFNGWYLYYIQDIGRSKHSLVARYDTYDPNTKLSKNNCQTVGDVSRSTFGLGWLFKVNENFRVICFYELKNNEKVNNDLVAEKFKKNLADDLFTMRLQYKF